MRIVRLCRTLSCNDDGTAFPSTIHRTGAILLLLLLLLSARIPSKAKKLIWGSPNPKKRKISSSNKLPGPSILFCQGDQAVDTY